MSPCLFHNCITINIWQQTQTKPFWIALICESIDNYGWLTCMEGFTNSCVQFIVTDTTPAGSQYKPGWASTGGLGVILDILILSFGSMGSPSSDIYPGGGVSVGGTALCGDSIFAVSLGHIPTVSIKPAGCWRCKLKVLVMWKRGIFWYGCA